MPESTLQALADKLIPWAVGAILTVVGALGAALAAMYQWVFKRQVERLDDNIKRTDDAIEFVGDLDKSQEILAMQLSVVQQNADDQKLIHKESMENIQLATDKTVEAIHAKIDADNLRHEKRMDRTDDYFRQFLELSSRRRADDN